MAIHVEAIIPLFEMVGDLHGLISLWVIQSLAIRVLRRTRYIDKWIQGKFPAEFSALVAWLGAETNRKVASLFSHAVPKD